MYYYTYMLRCKDNSIYTGYTNNMQNRIKSHFLKNKQGAKYTKSHEVTKIECVWRSKEKSLACKLEYQLKQLKKSEKEKIIQGEKIKNFLNEKVDCRKYYMLSKIKINEILDKETNEKI